MTEEARRRLGAVAALVAGLFLGLTLLPFPLTGPIGGGIGRLLWKGFGAGAIGVPLLGFGLALSGFNRTPRISMKQAALLLGGLSLLVPYFIGVITRVTAQSFDPPLEQWSLTARAIGVIPGFIATAIYNLVGFAGGLLLGFLALSALTLLTLAWHPLRRLEGVTPGEAGDEVPPPLPPPARARHELPPVSPPEDNEIFERPAREKKEKEKKPKKVPARLASGNGAEEEAGLPSVELLTQPVATSDAVADSAALDRLGQKLIDTLKTFKVEASIAGRTTGPVVTQFEVVPAPGVKAGRIAALADDMAITMRAPSIRVAPIPGKGAVGVEVPNPVARMVTIRELFDTEEWQNSRAALPIALGRDLEGKPVIADLSKMPHLLIAGATGSGKSVAINTIITSLVYHYGKKDLRLLMVDPKMVELSMYNDLPHLRHKVVTNNHDAATVLKWAVSEMDRRYKLLHANNARNLADFNRKAEEGKPLRMPERPKLTLSVISAEAPDTPPEPEEAAVYTDGPLPLVVMIVDELADLMMTVQGEVETPLAMLAQKARAIGIHIILATQRPSVNVITGLIKANFPCRIAFRVASKVDSRTILDQNGAEALLGNGDMLFLPPGKSEPMRLQGAFIATEDTERMMDWFKERRNQIAQGTERPESDILEEVRAQEALEDGEGASPQAEGGDRDPLFRKAAEACIQNQGGSTSLLQRKLQIGYGRAARIIDQLHYAGILSPPDGSKPREVLIGFHQLDEYCD
jgi:S-DNA-T family DNA segregation ATPase FtsK/SpoIIIE